MSVQYGSHVWSQLLIAVHDEETRVLPVETTARGTSILKVAQYDAKERAMTRQPTVAAVIHPAKLLLNLFRKRLTR